MDALVAKCLNCGETLKEPRKLKDFCTHACRGQKAARNNKELRRVKMQSVGSMTFAKVNSCTYRVDTRNKRAAGWLMEVAWAG